MPPRRATSYGQRRNITAPSAASASSHASARGKSHAQKRTREKRDDGADEEDDNGEDGEDEDEDAHMNGDDDDDDDDGAASPSTSAHPRKKSKLSTTRAAQVNDDEEEDDGEEEEEDGDADLDDEGGEEGEEGEDDEEAMEDEQDEEDEEEEEVDDEDDDIEQLSTTSSNPILSHKYSNTHLLTPAQLSALQSSTAPSKPPSIVKRKLENGLDLTMVVSEGVEKEASMDGEEQKEESKTSSDSGLFNNNGSNTLPSTLSTILSSYRDLILTTSTPLTAKTVHASIASHIVSHLLTVRAEVTAHDRVIRAAEEKEKQRKEDFRRARKEWRDQLALLKKHKNLQKDQNKPLPSQPQPPPPIDIPEHRDSGFNRPRVLCIFPTAKVAYEFTQKMMQALPEGKKKQQMRRARFERDFATTPDDRCDPTKPFDYKYYFDGKDNDSFRCGISFLQKGLAYYTPFHASDILICSSLGLRQIVGSIGDKPEDRDYDFLSSIEICLIDAYDVVTNMQNGVHLETVMDVVNQIPYDTKHTDFARVRQWNLDGNAKYYRQNIVLSAYNSRELYHFQKKYCLNSSGKVIVTKSTYDGVLSLVVPTIKQYFHRLYCEKLSELPQQRFEFFTTTILPRLRDLSDGGILLYIPSYFDYVLVRNYLKAKHQTLALASEYTKNSELSRGRSDFFHGHRKYLIVTERFHFYKRYVMRGVKHVVFYSPPTYQQFYLDFVNLVPNGGTVTMCYSKYDMQEVERIVETKRAETMKNAQKTTHLFC